MGLKYQPKTKSVLICDFTGSILPEMNKKRPVVVVSKHPDNSKLVTVVPVSTTAPTSLKGYHYEFPNNPLPDKTEVCWAKCDMVYTISIDRLSQYVSKDSNNIKKTHNIVIDDSCYVAIKIAIASALGIIVK